MAKALATGKIDGAVAAVMAVGAAAKVSHSARLTQERMGLEIPPTLLARADEVIE